MSSIQMIDRPGIFKASPVEWKVTKSTESNSASINIKFLISAMLQGDGSWLDWMQYGEWYVFGSYCVIKRDGGVNVITVEQLRAALGWQGTFAEVANTKPPDTIVQVTVKESTHKDVKRYRAEWMNPGDYTPEFGETPEGAKAMDSQYGSLLRAAASSTPVRKAKAVKPKPKDPEAQGSTVFEEAERLLKANAEKAADEFDNRMRQ